MRKETIRTCESMRKTIRDLRRSQGLTQAQLAGQSNAGILFICNQENGKETCHLGKTLHVLDTLGFEIIIHSPYDKE